MDLDPLTVPALVATITAVVAGATGEAGAQAWNVLADLVRRTFRQGSRERELVEDDLTNGDAPDAGSVDDLARRLVTRASDDRDFAAALRSWAATVHPAASDRGSVTNIVDGNARVNGGLLQTREVHGPITFGGTNQGR
jgi:hypothetical protein